LNARTQRIALTVGGSDSSGQAGVQADLRTFAAHDVHALSAFTALTVQDHERVLDIEPVSPPLLERQVTQMLSSFPVRAIKTGMLVSGPHVAALCSALSSHANIPLVVDPVLLSTSGTRLLDDAGEEALVSDLLPRADVFTPNLPEAMQLTASSADTPYPEIAAACAALINPRGIVVLKGGHGGDPGFSRDLVRMPNGVLFQLETPRIETGASRGTGCTFSAAIAAGIANGLTADSAVRKAKAYITGALRHGVILRAGRGPVAQLWDLLARKEQTRD